MIAFNNKRSTAIGLAVLFLLICYTIPFPIRTLDFGIKGGTSLDAIKLDLTKEKDG